MTRSRKKLNWNGLSLNANASAGFWWLLAAAVGSNACASAAPPTDEQSQSSEQAVTGVPSDGSCGFTVTSKYFSRPSGKGYIGELELKNVSGPRATQFEVFADLGGSTIKRRCLFADCKPVEDGYTFTEPPWLRLLGLRRGQTLPILYGSPDPYASVAPYVISVNGVKCDTVAPQISLSGSRALFTSNGTLQLTASASDNVAVRKVEFLRDGVVFAVDEAAPFTASATIDAAQNGRHAYTAVAYDPSGNTATSSAVRVLTGIGNKFFGTAVDTAADYTRLIPTFNQITPGNAGKWGSVEATRDQMDWTKLDVAYQYAKDHGMAFKLHTLIWGQQQPAWLASLTPEQQLAEIEQWMSLLAQRYPDVRMVDVVNEPLHAPPSYSAALGGAGATGWDWAVKSFELARKYFPRAELLLNDYSIESLDSATSAYLEIIKVLADRGLLDGIGLQGHFLERAEPAVVAANLERMGATGLPIYVTELDVNFANDARQAQRMRDLFTLFWQHPAVLGVTHWGYLQGNVWQTDAYLMRTDGSPRPALDWINCFRAGGGSGCTVPDYVPEPRTGDASGITLEAEDYDDAHGVVAAGSVVAYIDPGDWERFDRVVFDPNWDSLSVTYANGGSAASGMAVHRDSIDGPIVASVSFSPTGGWGTNQTVSVPFLPLSGEHTLFITYTGGVNVDRFVFGASSSAGPNLVANADFETDTSGWYTWNGTLSTSTQYAFSGAQSLHLSNPNGNGPVATNLTGLVTAGKSYDVSLWATISGAASANINVTQAVSCDGQPAYKWFINPTPVQAGQWTQLSGALLIPNCNVTDVQIFAEGLPSGVDMFIDHVSVRAPGGSPVTNLIPDGTFESQVGSWFSWGSGTFALSSARAHGGSNSLLFSGRSANAPIARSLVGLVTPDKTYQLSLWASVGGAASANINVTQAMGCDGNTSYSWIVNPVAVNDGSWVNLTGTVTVPNCNLTTAMVYAEGPDAGVDVYLDDVVLSP